MKNKILTALAGMITMLAAGCYATVSADNIAIVLMAVSPDDFGAIMTLANQELCRDNDTMMFVTVFIAQLDLLTGELIYVNAGHTAPCLREMASSAIWCKRKSTGCLG